MQNQKTQIVMLVLIISILEEILFRGVINQIALEMKSNYKIILVLAGVMSFGISHLFSGWQQLVSKLIFSCLMAILFFISGTILAPIISHAIFNFCVVKKYPEGC